MDFAREKGYVVLTHDLDFSAILAATHGSKPSVVQIRSEDVSPHIIGKQVVAALQQMAADLEQGRIADCEPKADSGTHTPSAPTRRIANDLTHSFFVSAI